MLKKHQIKKIIKQMVPSSVYSNPQRKMLRETAKTELYDYITKYPDATYANLQQQFCDNEIINSKQMQTSKKNHEINDRYRRTIIYCLPYCLFYCRQFGAADLCFLISL